MAAIPTPASGITSGSTSARAPTGTSGSTGQRFLPRPAFSVRMNSGRRALASCSARSSMPGRGGALFRTAGDKPVNSCCCGAWRRSTNRCIRRWTTRCATPASTSATIWRTAILISPASPSTSACRPRVRRTCSASSWGVSVLGWREDQRISQAKLLLSTTRMPIATVGRNVGFEDQLYFSRVFKKNALGPARANSARVVNKKKESEMMTRLNVTASKLLRQLMA